MIYLALGSWGGAASVGSVASIPRTLRCVARGRRGAIRGIVIERVDADVTGKTPVEPMHKPKLLKPFANDGDRFTDAVVMGVVDPIVFQEICRM